MYYGGGQEEAYSYAMIGYIAEIGLTPLLIIAAVALFAIARARKTHKKLFYGLSITTLILALVFAFALMQGKPRCCGEGITFNQSHRFTS